MLQHLGSVQQASFNIYLSSCFVWMKRKKSFDICVLHTVVTIDVIAVAGSRMLTLELRVIKQ